MLSNINIMYLLYKWLQLRQQSSEKNKLSINHHLFHVELRLFNEKTF